MIFLSHFCVSSFFYILSFSPLIQPFVIISSFFTNTTTNPFFFSSLSDLIHILSQPSNPLPFSFYQPLSYLAHTHTLSHTLSLSLFFTLFFFPLTNFLSLSLSLTCPRSSSFSLYITLLLSLSLSPPPLPLSTFLDSLHASTLFHTLSRIHALAHSLALTLFLKWFFPNEICEAEVYFVSMLAGFSVLSSRLFWLPSWKRRANSLEHL